jgi:hypothetical protein
MTTQLKWLLGVLGILFVANIIYYFVNDWGKITVNFKDAPASKVFAEIGRQAGVPFITNLDPDTKVTIRLTKATLDEAVDTLAVSTETRGSLFYILAPNKQELANGTAALMEGRRRGEDGNSDWQWHSHPLPGMLQMAADDVMRDYSKEIWQPTEAPAGNELNNVLESFSLYTNCSFINPTNWNPALSKIPANGRIQSAVKQAASLAGGKMEKVFYFRGRPRNFAQNQDGPPRDGGGGERQGNWQRGDNQFNLDASWIQARVKQLPPDARQAFTLMQEMQKLTPEQRRARFEQMMNDPAFQDQMDQRQLDRDAKTPADKRAARYSRYLSNKASAPAH